MTGKESLPFELNRNEDSKPDQQINRNLIFSIDRSSIPNVPRDDQNGDLYSLGVDIYEHEALEKGILHQVGEAVQKQKQNKMITELSDNTEKGGKLDIDDSKPSISNCHVRDDNDQWNAINFGNCNLKESELAKKIKVGEMTPFGTFVPLKTSELCIDKMEKQLKNETEVVKKCKEPEKKGYAGSDNVDHSVEENERFMKRELLKKKNKIFIPKKRKRQPVFESDKSEEIRNQKKKSGKTLCEAKSLAESSCSEYVPTDSDFSNNEDCGRKIRVKRKKRNSYKFGNLKNEDNWKTDDSDWEYSDCEGIIKKNCKSGKKEIDDGDIDLYMRRLSIWEKKNNRERIETDVKSFSDGFKIPLIIWNRLFNYQKVGVQWLWELHIQRCGGILGDEMGLGKTVQVIAFFSGLSVSKLISKHGSFKGLGPVLIICPTTVMHQWVRELHQWWPQFRVALMHESGNYSGKRSKLIQEICTGRGILITSFANCVQQIGALTKYLWHYVVIDEGHKIRNPDSQIATAVKQLKTPHRLILSGSPMQNNLKELWSLFDFIFPGKLGTLPVFLSEFAVPITQGGFTNATQVQVATAFKCATVVKDTISPYLLRRVKQDVKNHINLPMKNEQVLFCKLTDEQRSLYLDYLNSREVDSILSGRYKVFVGLINLRKICNHPHLYSGGPKLFKWDEIESVPEEEKFGYWKKAGKMIVVETLLKIWKRQGHRVLVFTQSKQMLRVLESFVQFQGYQYLRLDGTTNISSRQPLIRKFNEDRNYFIFLSTTRVGGLGVNLTGADRVVIYDPDWNPATDVQARERAWRIGQNKQVTIYRLVTSGTIEEKIYHRQIFKQFLTNKVLKDPRQRRFFKSNDLHELFTLNDTGRGKTETSALFAGLGSEVDLKRLSHRMKSKNKIQKPSEISEAAATNTILSREKVDSMKKLAKLLSRQITKETIDLSMNPEPEKVERTNLDSSVGYDKNAVSADVLIEPLSLRNDDGPSKWRKYGSHRRKKKKECFDTFEGEVVPHLVNKLEYKECLKLQNEYTKEQDDYILGKLFSKSGIKTALQHDRIMDEGPSDYALVEGEAEKVAKEAARALRESRKHYFRTVENTPVFAKPRFGANSKKKAFTGDINSSHDDFDNKKVMSSSELLYRMKERNRLLNNNLSDLPSDHSHEQLDLLSDIRNFVSFEAKVNNVASTQEIINRFRGRLPEGTSPLFRALLLEICEFYRDSSGRGIWRLRQDFRW